MNAVIFCLAIGLFFEARGEPVSGQISVVHVILNRVKDTRYPDNVCDVVYQARKKNGKIVKHKCQFSFYCDGLSDRPSNHDAFRWARHVSMLVLFGLTKDPTDGATHYHTKAVNPDWRINKKHTATIGNHIFYRWLKKPPA